MKKFIFKAPPEKKLLFLYVQFEIINKTKAYN